ncbi:5-hydroxytryptamine receptor 3A-like [Paramormyrops kingsleyae]|uniref:5-hydroxytryptamine receptor 3A-like n=1 Tax=Paramormyrops kingsleyae TaxID=1676925 RepID=UPI003B97388C
MDKRVQGGAAPRIQTGIPGLNGREELALFICILCLYAPNITRAVTLNCSQPDAKSLYVEIEKTFYLSAVRPVYSLKTPTNVTLSVTLYSILGVDEKTQILTTYLWLNLEWYVEYLSWDPVQCGTAVVTLPRKKLWVPDIGINECMDGDTSPKTTYVYLYSSGLVSDSRPVRAISSCNLDIYTFPFDVQNCSLTFNSYTYLDYDLRVDMGISGEETLRYSKLVMTTIGEWELLDIKAIKVTQYNFSNETYDTIVYHIVMRRRPTMYVVNLLIPSCFLMIVDLLSFLLPPEAVDRATFKMTIILGYTVFLLIMNDLLPITGNRLPLLNVVFSVCLALMVASLLETIIITKILCKSNHSAVPHWVKILVFKYLAWLVRFPQKPGDQVTDTHSTTTEASSAFFISHDAMKLVEPAKDTEAQDRTRLAGPAVEELKKLSQDLLAIRSHAEEHLPDYRADDEWTQIGHIIDRFLFILYLLFISFSIITFTVFWVIWSSQ